MLRVGVLSTERIFSVKGFTLIELVIVLMILGLITSLTLPLFSKSISVLGLSRSTQEMTAALRYARGAAIKYQTPVWLTINIEEDSYWLGDSVSAEAAIPGVSNDKAIELPGKVEIEGFKWFDGSDAAQVGWIEFYPNGSSSGGTLVLSDERGERTRKIIMEPLTGLSRVERVPYVK